MNKGIVAGGVSIAAIGALVAGVWLGTSNVAAQHTALTTADKQAAVSTAQDYAASADVAQTAAVTQGQVSAQVIAEQKAAAEAAAAKAAAAQAAQQAAAQKAAQQQTVTKKTTTRSTTTRSAAQAPAEPIKCPAGSQAVSGDAGNDTSCLPVICFTIVLPDAAHPECDTPFKP